MRVRTGLAADWPVCQDIERRAGERFREVGLADIAEHDPPTDAELDEALAVLVAVDDLGEIVGYAWVEEVDGHAHLEQLSVPPEYGGLGVGTALLDAVAAWAREHRDAEITLTTYRDVPFNAPVYAKRGFEVVPEAEWTPGLRALVAEEATHGLDPSQRVVMRRVL